jgi:hypothetical protein
MQPYEEGLPATAGWMRSARNPNRLGPDFHIALDQPPLTVANAPTVVRKGTCLRTIRPPGLAVLEALLTNEAMWDGGPDNVKILEPALQPDGHAVSAHQTPAPKLV